jgi:peptidoglycan/LPS O-acetylase OafA/YrhL
MSKLLARIMLALLMLPLASALYVMLVSWLVVHVFRYSREVATFATTSLVVWAFVAVYWVLLWRGTVRWTRRRIALTVGAAGGAALVGTGGGALLASIDDSLATFIGGVLAVLLWLVCTVRIWRETRAERVERLRARSPDAIICPACGYNLTGLRWATCPECGASYTVDELAALQPQREAAEL